MSLSLRSTLARYLPPWLTARIVEGKVRGFKFLSCASLLADAGLENAHQALQARFPGHGTPTALPYIGRDRGIRRGIDESDESYASRLVLWLDTWRGAGNPFAIMHQVRAYCAPAVPKLRIVNDSGTWYTLNPDDSIEIVQTFGAINYDWDGLYPSVRQTRCWLIIYSDAGPRAEGPDLGDGTGLWSDAIGTEGYTIGTTATYEQVQSVRAIVDDFKSTGDRFENIIVAFDPASFDPTAAPGAPGMPDGTWGHYSKNVGGTQVAARLSTAAYWEGV